MQDKSKKPGQEMWRSSLEFGLDSSGVERERENAVIRKMAGHPCCENDIPLQRQKGAIEIRHTAFD